VGEAATITIKRLNKGDKTIKREITIFTTALVLGCSIAAYCTPSCQYSVVPGSTPWNSNDSCSQNITNVGTACEVGASSGGVMGGIMSQACAGGGSYGTCTNGTQIVDTYTIQNSTQSCSSGNACIGTPNVPISTATVSSQCSGG
jgi:hypothetical protein